MLLSEIITRLTNIMSEVGNVVVEGVHEVRHHVNGDAHTVEIVAHQQPEADVARAAAAKPSKE